MAGDLLILGVDRCGCGMGVCVHGSNAGVVLLRDEISMLGKARLPLEHVHTGVLLRLLRWLLMGRNLVLLWVAVVLVRAAGEAVPVSVWLLHVEAVDVVAKISKRLGAMEVVAVGAHHVDAGRRPLHGVASGRRGRLVTASLGHRVVHLGGVDSALVRTALVLYHGGFPAEAAQKFQLVLNQGGQRRTR